MIVAQERLCERVFPSERPLPKTKPRPKGPRRQLEDAHQHRQRRHQHVGHFGRGVAAECGGKAQADHPEKHRLLFALVLSVFVVAFLFCEERWLLFCVVESIWVWGLRFEVYCLLV